MNQTPKSLVAFLALAASLALAVPVAAAARVVPATPAAPANEPALQKKNTRYPISGKLAGVDQAAKTFTLKGAKQNRVFKVNAQTKITRHGKTATLADAVVGEEVGGYVEKQGDGSLLALSVRFGPKAPAGGKDMPPANSPDPKSQPKAPAPK
jgi:hypothetical protein